MRDRRSGFTVAPGGRSPPAELEVHGVGQRREVPAPGEAVALHGTDEARVLVRLAADRVRCRVEVDRYAPGVEGQRSARLDPAWRVAAGVLGRVHEVAETAASELRHR